MHTLSKIAMLAVVAGLSTVPAMAAPPMNNMGGGGSAFCADPMHKNLPGCMPGNTHNSPPPPPPGGNPPPPMGGNGHGPGPGGMGFHQRFGGFNFGTFGVPGFSITIGGQVPHSYNSLRPVPRSVYKFYPQYRGYLFFVGRHGDFVIVSPRSHRIVAVL